MTIGWTKRTAKSHELRDCGSGLRLLGVSYCCETQTEQHGMWFAVKHLSLGPLFVFLGLVSSCFESRQPFLQELVLPFQTLHLVQQHRIEHLILYGFDFAIGGMGDQIRVNLCHFLGNQAVLNRLRSVREGLFVAESDGTEAHQVTAGVAHVGDVFLESAGRADGAELASGTDENGNRVVARCGDAAYPRREE